jgi:hypothetical protein
MGTVAQVAVGLLLLAGAAAMLRAAMPGGRARGEIARRNPLSDLYTTACVGLVVSGLAAIVETLLGLPRVGPQGSARPPLALTRARTGA